MTNVAKLAISLPDSLARRARRAVRLGRAPSLSAYVGAALEEKVKLDELSVLLDEMLAESGGPLTNTEIAALDRELGATTKKRRKRA